MAEDSRKLFVAGLPDSVTEDVLRQLFEATGGSVVEVSLPKDRATGRPRGFGFVTLASPEEANAARESLDGSFQGGKSISVRPFQAEPPRRDGPREPGAPHSGGGYSGGGRDGPRGDPAGGGPDRTLYVGNLPYDASVEEVEALIGQTGAGPVVRVHLPADPEGRKRGFGFVTMGSAESAKAAIEALKTADVRGRRLVVNLAHPKGERPPQDNRGPRDYPPRSGGGGPGGGGFREFPPAFDAPAPQRKTFDDRRRRTHGDGEGVAGPGAGAGAKRGAGGGGGGAAGGGRREKNRNNWEDWDED